MPTLSETYEPIQKKHLENIKRLERQNRKLKKRIKELEEEYYNLTGTKYEGEMLTNPRIGL